MSKKKKWHGKMICKLHTRLPDPHPDVVAGCFARKTTPTTCRRHRVLSHSLHRAMEPSGTAKIALIGDRYAFKRSHETGGVCMYLLHSNATEDHRSW